MSVMSSPIPVGPRYAWVIVAVLTFLLAISHGLITSGISVFDAEILKDLGIGRGDLKFRDFLQLFAAGVWSLVIGYAAERTGPRLIIYTGLVVLTGALMAYAQVQSVQQIYVLHLLLAFAYASCHVVIVILIITRWFATKKGIALGIILAGESMGGTLFPQIVVRLIDAFGWRHSMQILACIPVLLAILLLLLLRRDPESHGLRPLGAEIAPQPGMPGAATVASAPRAGDAAPFRQVLLHPGTILLLIVAATLFYSGGGFVAHSFLYFSDSGFSPDQAAYSLSLIFITAFAGKLGAGFLADRFGTHPVWILFQISLLVGAVLLVLGHPVLLWVGTMLLGLGWGGCYTTTHTIITERFTGPWLGRLSGIAVLVEGIAAGLGVWLTGVLYDHSGSYQFPFTVMSLVVLTALTCSILLSSSRAARERPVAR